MSFQDIFKSSFLENNQSLTLFDMFIALVLASLLGLFIFYIYKKSYRGVMYSDSFGMTLIAMTLITTLLILTIVSNVVLSLGMVGALSIVRFRTAVKEPMDIVFLFWSIAIGIVLAAGQIFLAVFGSMFIGAVIYIFSNKQSTDFPYILMIRYTGEEQEFLDIILRHVKKMKLKSKIVKSDYIELNFEIRLKNEDSSFIQTINDMNNVKHIVLVSYNGDYMG